MARLLRPSIPLSVQLCATLLQLGTSRHAADEMVAETRKARALKSVLSIQLLRIAELFRCSVDDLQLDHDPALVTRVKRIQLPNGKIAEAVVIPKNAKVLRYYPDANDPEHLRWRPHAADIAGSHDIKTRIRGDRGQLSDLALARKAKRAAKKAEERPRPKRSAMLLPKVGARRMAQNGKKSGMGGAARGKLRGRGFPPKGSRKFGKKP